MIGHDYSPTCGCPGCQFIWAGLQAYEKFGPPPVIGTFNPMTGDVGRDIDDPLSQYRTWLGDRWHPSYEVAPKGTAVSPLKINKRSI